MFVCSDCCAEAIGHRTQSNTTATAAGVGIALTILVSKNSVNLLLGQRNSYGSTGKERVRTRSWRIESGVVTSQCIAKSSHLINSDCGQVQSVAESAESGRPLQRVPHLSGGSESVKTRALGRTNRTGGLPRCPSFGKKRRNVRKELWPIGLVLSLSVARHFQRRSPRSYSGRPTRLMRPGKRGSERKLSKSGSETS